ncbi:hypothetical protein BCY90_17380 [Agrobacterium deltaense]|uniref:hypothetical protein n=1 Tax=Agrobacterium TaxID=357 RepID=UPI000745A36B|nr:MULTISPECIES: hypothetical protein [Agrobacterium]KVK43581.1 hypothetical protein L901_26435 [Agrobacterium sp. D14]RKF41578.1 hypothetical protein BCY90_17380 [Agrobacterium deltaense]
MNAWATTIISGLVLVVAFMQWRTAHQKVLLDLFERRFNIYSRALKIIDQTLGPEASTFPEDLPSLAEESRLLFGEEVYDYLRGMVKPLASMGSDMFLARQIDHSSYLEKNPYFDVDNTHTGERTAAVWKANSDEAQRLKAALLSAVSPYLRMDQKQILTPAQWFEKRNRIRLSYADEKQK